MTKPGEEESKVEPDPNLSSSDSGRILKLMEIVFI